MKQILKLRQEVFIAEVTRCDAVLHFSHIELQCIFSIFLFPCCIMMLRTHKIYGEVISVLGYNFLLYTMFDIVCLKSQVQDHNCSKFGSDNSGNLKIIKLKSCVYCY